MLLKAFAATLLALSQISYTSISVSASSPTALNTSTNQTYSFDLWGDMPYARNGDVPSIATVIRQTEQFSDQVLLMHGDTHFFKIDKPLYGSAKGLTNLSKVPSV